MVCTHISLLESSLDLQAFSYCFISLPEVLIWHFALCIMTTAKTEKVMTFRQKITRKKTVNSGECFGGQHNPKKVLYQIIHFDKQSFRRWLPGSRSQGSLFRLLVVHVLSADVALWRLSGLEVR